MAAAEPARGSPTENRKLRYPVVAGAVLTAFLVVFLLAMLWTPALVADPSARLRQADARTALLGVGLLVVDSALPIPASLVMIAHGAAFGVVLGTALSVLGSAGATLVGFGLGRRGGALLTRLVRPGERAAADRLLARWGALAIVLTRPVPLVAETVAVLAGASSLGWGRAALAAVVGALPTALVYALTGAVAADLRSGAAVFGAVVLVSGAAWLAGGFAVRRLPGAGGTT